MRIFGDQADALRVFNKVGAQGFTLALLKPHADAEEVSFWEELGKTES